MLAEFFDFMRDNSLEGVIRRQTILIPTILRQGKLRSRSLHLNLKRHRMEGIGGLVVEREVGGERLAELDGAEGGWEGEEEAGVGEVSEGLWVALEGQESLEGERRGG